MARVYALRGLSRRFPQAVEAQLADADRACSLPFGASTFPESLLTSAPCNRLARLLPQVAAAGTHPPASWQARAGRIFTVAATGGIIC